ncbi:MAG: poly(3-hydroxybutyrate) depolymerase [Pseudomonadota bacterium]
MSRLLLFVLAVLATGCATPTARDEVRVLRNDLSVSGISSGGYAAGLLHLAHADRINGIGIIAAGPWNCALGNLGRALGPCIKGDGLDVAALVTGARDAAAAGDIAPLEHINGDRVWLLHGERDTTVAAAVVQAAMDFYNAFSAGGNYIGSVPAAHGFPTFDTGVACNEFREPYLQACRYDAAEQILTNTVGRTMVAPAETPGGDFIELAQAEGAGLADTGVAYIPKVCRQRACHVHMTFHGCRQGREFLGDAFIEGAGFNRWADTNELIILYPQVASSPLNPLGCWDWWGYTGADYATRNGKQIQAMMMLIDQLEMLP